MDQRLTAILGRMLGPDDGKRGLPILDPSPWLAIGVDPLARVTAAFLVAAAGVRHPDHARAVAALTAPVGPATGLAAFYRSGLDRMVAEVDRVNAEQPEVAARLAAALGASTSAEQTREAIWAAFFPCRTANVAAAPGEPASPGSCRRTSSVSRMVRDLHQPALPSGSRPRWTAPCHAPPSTERSLDGAIRRVRVPAPPVRYRSS